MQGDCPIAVVVRDVLGKSRAKQIGLPPIVLQPPLGSNPCVGLGVGLSGGWTLEYLGHRQTISQQTPFRLVLNQLDSCFFKPLRLSLASANPCLATPARAAPRRSACRAAASPPAWRRSRRPASAAASQRLRSFR